MRRFACSTRGLILLVVYTAFSAPIEGAVEQVPLSALGGLLVVNAVLLTLALVLTTLAARKLGFDKADEIHRVLRLQERARLQRRADGQGVLFPGRVGGCDRAAADALPPDAVDGLRGAGPALCAPPTEPETPREPVAIAKT